MANDHRLMLALRKPVLQALQDWFSDTYQIGTGIFDEHAGPLTFETSHHEYCRTIRRTPEGIHRCRRSDQKLIEECTQVKDVVWHLCENGLLDFAVPIMAEGNAIAFLLAGQLRGAIADLRTTGDVTSIGRLAEACRVPKSERRRTRSRLSDTYENIRIRTSRELMQIEDAARHLANLLSWVITKTTQWEPDKEVLGEYLREAVRAETIDALLALSVRMLPKIIGSRHCSIFLVGEDVEHGDRLILRRTSYAKLRPMESTAFYTRGQGLTGWVWTHARSLRLRDGSNAAELAAIDSDDPPRPSGHLKDSQSIHEFLCVPVFDHERKVVGVIRTPTKAKGFSLDDEIALTTLGEYLYSLIERCRNREGAADAHKAFLTALTLQGCSSTADVWKSTVSAAVRFWGPQQKAYFLNVINADMTSFSTEWMEGQLSQKDLWHRRYSLKGTTTGYVLGKREAILIHDLDGALDTGRYLPAIEDGHSAMASPIALGKRVFAVLGIVAGQRYAFAEKDRTLLSQLCLCAGQAVERIQDRDRTAEYEKFLAVSQLLTGLRHDLGTPMEHVDLYLRGKLDARPQDMVLLAEFVLHGLSAYQFVPAVSSDERFVGLEESLRRRVSEQADGFNLRELMADCVRVVDQCFTPSPRCVVRCPDKYRIKADYHLLMLVLYNLLKNARQYSRSGTRASIIVSALRQGKMNIITVSDRNLPIPDGQRSSLFDFRPRLDHGQVHKVGLPLARLFVRAHPGPSETGNGTISYEYAGQRNIFQIKVMG